MLHLRHSLIEKLYKEREGERERESVRRMMRESEGETRLRKG